MEVVCEVFVRNAGPLRKTVIEVVFLNRRQVHICARKRNSMSDFSYMVWKEIIHLVSIQAPSFIMTLEQVDILYSFGTGPLHHRACIHVLYYLCATFKSSLCSCLVAICHYLTKTCALIALHIVLCDFFLRGCYAISRFEHCVMITS